MSVVGTPRTHAYAAQALRTFLDAPPVYAYARHGSRWRKPWTPKEIEKLESLCGKMRLGKIAEQLGRTEPGTRKMITTLGLRLTLIRDREPDLDAAQEERARQIVLLFSPRAREIIRAVAQEHDVAIASMLSRSRKAKLVGARQHLIWRMIRDTSMTMSQIGLKLGLDHTTCRHAVLREDARQGTNVHAKVAAKRGQS